MIKLPVPDVVELGEAASELMLRTYFRESSLELVPLDDAWAPTMPAPLQELPE